MADYRDVYEAIIWTAVDMIGPVARTQANTVEGIRVTDDGAIETDHELRRGDIEALIDAYKGIMGDGAYGIGKQAIRSLEAEGAKGLEELDLPFKILPPGERASRFAHAI